MKKEQQVTEENKNETINSLQSKVLSRLQQQASFIGAYKNMDEQQSEVEKAIEK